MAFMLALAALGVSGSSNLLRAAGDPSCVVGGAGVLCFTKSEQECVAWTVGTTIGISLGGFTVGITPSCSKWVTTTYYYNKDTGGGGGSGGPSNPGTT